MVQTLPLLAELRRRHPQASIGWGIEAAAAPLLEGHPEIDHLHISHRRRWLQMLWNPFAWRRLFQEIGAWLGEIRTQRYEVSLDTQGLLKSALIPWLVGIPRRVGYAPGREGSHWFYTETLPAGELYNPHIPAAEQFRSLARLSAPTMDIGPEPLETAPLEYPLPPLHPARVEKVRHWLEGNPTGQPIVALAPATVWASKHWTESGWQTLIQRLVQDDCFCVLLGTKAEQPLIHRLSGGLAENPRLLNLAGQTDLNDLTALFYQTDLFIGLDSAPLHLANAVAYNRPDGLPRVVGIYGPTAPGRTGPTGKQHQTVQTRLNCQPCFERTCPIQTHDCMQELSPNTVWERVQAQRHLLSAGVTTG